MDDRQEFESQLEDIRSIEGRLIGINNATETEVERYMEERAVSACVQGWEVFCQPYQEQDGSVSPNTLYLSIYHENIAELTRQLLVGESVGVEVRDIFHRILDAYGDGSWSHRWEKDAGRLECISTHDEDQWPLVEAILDEEAE